jgi:N12 class adenine-specific DNA methylase
MRARLRDAYTAYASRYGPLNRYTLRRTGRSDPETGEERMARITPPAVRLLCQHDPFGPLVRALENFDDSTQTASPAALLSERVVQPRTPRLGADTPQDALGICLDTHARVDLAEIARLLGIEAEEARERLGELVYHDPAAGRLLPAAEYLSGNVRVKLDQARAAAAGDTSLEVNVRALERVLPPDLGPEEITPRLGAAWLDADTHRQFLSELLEDPDVVVEHPGAAIWAVKGRTWTVKAASEWGTSRIDALALAKAVMEQRPIRVTDEIDVGDRTKRVLNPTETAAAQEKADALQERFGEWCWEDPERAASLTAAYNERFNSLVLRDYSTAGEHLALPGIARTFAPREHQRAAVARILAEPAVGLFHEVGAGKTAEMVIGAMELRRLGLVSKPAVVVPNHMLDQFSREWLQIYPQARVLAASGEDLAGDRRRQFVARVAANDWDAVIMTRSAFSRLPVSTDTEAAYESQQVGQLRAMLDRAKSERGLTVKVIEKQIARREQRLKTILDVPRDPGVTFEETGLDYLLIDFTSRPFRARLVRSRGCGAVWRTHRKPHSVPATRQTDPHPPPRRPAVRSQPGCGRRALAHGWTRRCTGYVTVVPARWAGPWRRGPGCAPDSADERHLQAGWFLAAVRRSSRAVGESSGRVSLVCGARCCFVVVSCPGRSVPGVVWGGDAADLRLPPG